MNNRHRLVARLLKTHCRLTPEEVQEIFGLIIKAVDEWVKKTKNRPEMQDVPNRMEEHHGKDK